jgi:hypothetical protein
MWVNKTARVGIPRFSLTALREKCILTVAKISLPEMKRCGFHITRLSKLNELIGRAEQI